MGKRFPQAFWESSFHESSFCFPTRFVGKPFHQFFKFFFESLSHKYCKKAASMTDKYSFQSDGPWGAAGWYGSRSQALPDILGIPFSSISNRQNMEFARTSDMQHGRPRAMDILPHPASRSPVCRHLKVSIQLAPTPVLLSLQLPPSSSCLRTTYDTAAYCALA